MNNEDSIATFCIGLILGTAIALTGGYFIGTTVLKKTLQEHENEKHLVNANHLRRAQDCLDEEDPVPCLRDQAFACDSCRALDCLDGEDPGPCLRDQAVNSCRALHSDIPAAVVTTSLQSEAST